METRKAGRLAEESPGCLEIKITGDCEIGFVQYRVFVMQGNVGEGYSIFILDKLSRGNAAVRRDSAHETDNGLSAVMHRRRCRHTAMSLWRRQWWFQRRRTPSIARICPAR